MKFTDRIRRMIMSWDVYLIRTKNTTKPYEQIADEEIIPFTQKEVVDEIVLLARELELQTADLNTKFPHLRGSGWTIEFCFYDKEPCDTVELQVRGIHNPIEVFTRLKKDLRARIFDMHRGKYIEEESESGFEDWKNFTEKVINLVR